MKNVLNGLMNVGITVEIGLILFVIASFYTNQEWIFNLIRSCL